MNALRDEHVRAIGRGGARPRNSQTSRNLGQTAEKRPYWPGMSSDIKSYIDSCVPCQQARPSLARPKLLSLISPSQSLQPLRSISLDLFAAAGQDWLAMVDRFMVTLGQYGSPTRQLTICFLIWKPGSRTLAGCLSSALTTDPNFVQSSPPSVRPTVSHTSWHLPTIQKAMAWVRQLSCYRNSSTNQWLIHRHVIAFTGNASPA